LVSVLAINVHDTGGESTLETQKKNYEVLACGIKKRRKGENGKY